LESGRRIIHANFAVLLRGSKSICIWVALDFDCVDPLYNRCIV